MPLQTHKPEDRKHRLFVLYGPTGAGKSWLAASAESKLGGRTLILNTEDSESGLTGFDVDILTIRTMDDLRAAIQNLGTDPGPYKNGVLVLDSLSQMARFGLAVDAEEQFRLKNTKTPLNIGLDSYKRVGEDVRRSVWATRVLPMHVVLICLDRIFTSDDATVRMIGPNLTESLSGDIRAYGDLVAFMTASLEDVKRKEDGPVTREVVRRLHLQPGRDFYARVRAGKGVVVPDQIVNPTLEKVLKIFEPEVAKK